MRRRRRRRRQLPLRRSSGVASSVYLVCKACALAWRGRQAPRTRLARLPRPRGRAPRHGRPGSRKPRLSRGQWGKRGLRPASGRQSIASTRRARRRACEGPASRPLACAARPGPLPARFSAPPAARQRRRPLPSRRAAAQSRRRAPDWLACRARAAVRPGTTAPAAANVGSPGAGGARGPWFGRRGASQSPAPGGVTGGRTRGGRAGRAPAGARASRGAPRARGHSRHASWHCQQRAYPFSTPLQGECRL
jgi:hypothetical protein